MLLTRSPLIHPASWASAFDLHVLSTPPAFVLSQDQTLRTKTKTLKPRKTNQKTRSAIPTKNTQKQKTGIKQKQTNTLSSSQTTPTHSKAHRRTCITFERCFAPSSHDQASRFVRCRSAQQEELYALARRSSNRGFAPHLDTHFRRIPRFSARFSAISGHFSAIFMRQNTECHTKCVPRRASNRSSHTPDLAL